ncbi:MAG TPA: hypothetical protein VHL58_20285 [Thermoanaerobaculia bacterium]|nr:hypothetical protein [Thermoanaerobaculia bacterium]
MSFKNRELWRLVVALLIALNLNQFITYALNTALSAAARPLLVRIGFDASTATGFYISLAYTLLASVIAVTALLIIYKRLDRDQPSATAEPERLPAA